MRGRGVRLVLRVSRGPPPTPFTGPLPLPTARMRLRGWLGSEWGAGKPRVSEESFISETRGVRQSGRSWRCICFPVQPRYPSHRHSPQLRAHRASAGQGASCSEAPARAQARKGGPAAGGRQEPRVCALAPRRQHRPPRLPQSSAAAGEAATGGHAAVPSPNTLSPGPIPTPLRPRETPAAAASPGFFPTFASSPSLPSGKLRGGGGGRVTSRLGSTRPCRP